MYQFYVEYDSEAERKRLEYLLSQREGQVKRPSGYSFMVKDETYEDILKEIVSKFAPDKIKVYRVEDADVDVTLQHEEMKYRFNKSHDEVYSFLNYLVSRRKGILITSGPIDVYEIYSRKGRVELSMVINCNKTCEIILYLKGIKKAVDFIKLEFDQELKLFGGEKV